MFIQLSGCIKEHYKPKRCIINPPAPSPDGPCFRKKHQGPSTESRGQCWRGNLNLWVAESTGPCGSCLLGPRPWDSRYRTCCGRCRTHCSYYSCNAKLPKYSSARSATINCSSGQPGSRVLHLATNRNHGFDGS